MDQVKIGAFIAALRRERGWTQEELGARLGVTNKTVSRWETGRYMPDIETFVLLGRELEVSLDELVRGQRMETAVSLDRNALVTSVRGKKTRRERKHTAAGADPAIKYLTPLYLTLSTVGAGFYCLADFGKQLTAWAAILWLLLLTVAVTAVTIGKPYPALPLAAAAMTVLQLPILLCWVALSGHAVFYLFSVTFWIGPYGTVFHGGLFVLGLVIALRGLLWSGRETAAA